MVQKSDIFAKSTPLIKAVLGQKLSHSLPPSKSNAFDWFSAYQIIKIIDRKANISKCTCWSKTLCTSVRIALLLFSSSTIVTIKINHHSISFEYCEYLNFLSVEIVRIWIFVYTFYISISLTQTLVVAPCYFSYTNK